MSPLLPRLRILPIVVSLWISGHVLASGALITQNGSNAIGDSWDTPAYWSDGLAPSPDNDYVNALGSGTAGFTRTASTANAFVGRSLSLTNGSTLMLKHTSGTASVNLTLEANDILSNNYKGARLANGQTTGIGLNGTLRLIGAGTVTFDSQGSNRLTTVNSLLEADTSVSTIVLTALQTPLVSASKTIGFILTHSGNEFSGLWDVQQGLLKGVGLGTASFLIGERGYLDFDADFANAASTLTILSGGKILLDQDVSFGAVTINGRALSVGTYSAGDLMSDNIWGSAFDLESLATATITVIPEPSSLALITMSLGLVVAFRRKWIQEKGPGV